MKINEKNFITKDEVFFFFSIDILMGARIFFWRSFKKFSKAKNFFAAKFFLSGKFFFIRKIFYPENFFSLAGSGKCGSVLALCVVDGRDHVQRFRQNVDVASAFQIFEHVPHVLPLEALGIPG